MSFFGIPYYFQDMTTFDAEQLNADFTALLNASNSLQTQINNLGGTSAGIPNYYVASAAPFNMSPAASGAANVAALQAAVNTAIAAGGGTVFIPAGVYQMTGTVTINGNSAQPGLIISGASTGTQLFQQISNNDIFQISGFGTNNGAGCHIRNIWFQHPDNTSGTGIAIHLTGSCQGVDAYECIFNHCPQAFVSDANEGLQSGLRSCIIIQNKYSNPNVGQVQLGGTQMFVDTCLFRQNSSSAAGGPANNIGIMTNGGNSCRITNCQISAFDYGILIGGGTSARIWISNVQTETLVNGITIQPTASNKTIDGVYVANCDVKAANNSSSTSANGVYIDTNGGVAGNVQNINFTGCSVYGWNSSGYFINCAQDVNIVGGFISSNGLSPVSTLLGCGITVGSAGQAHTATHINVASVDMDGLYNFVTGTQPYAFGVYGGNNLQVTSCDLTNQGTGVLFGSSLIAFPNISIQSSRGYNDIGTSVSNSGISSGVQFTPASLGYYGPLTIYFSGSNTGMVAVLGAGSVNAYGTLANSSVVPVRIPNGTTQATLTWTGKGTINILGE